ncbi:MULTISPECIES: aminotransferase class I/II-fold pyridoxal phosphate-dependent enzyme [unclassified Rhizobium]|uniref:aminotransferase class I/II-fold pyridoxal phosphate-dependent enzyme n=1 Tax=unclassified Rhizobium TaxID=2613769 RepID=UPI000EA8EC51|nr:MULTISPECIES: aminotransferase class I/II-fold pyridoxal phosphate-dependent enzyme [unclassified Rhizobium]AYG69309.1 aminotransferase class I/II-fold pyridoxal phosphate-dependent enzyme [Rhizobium sp. CCGE531]AYG75688.1 aminotransferase class I/II-fold pyridoxal phosphate-dependent enzyme [Rhizobium sp. CCGE532]
MPDFTSALYLGLRHEHASLRPWRQLTTGRPAALGPSPETDELERALARFLGCGAVAVGPSTLHLFWDLFDMFADDDITVHIDSGAYAIARWGVERVAGRGVPVRTFCSHDVGALRASLARRPVKRVPLVVADGLNPLNGKPAPLPDYLGLVRQGGGWLILDDTQALGILGEYPSPARPLGLGGAGVPAWFGLPDTHLIRVASLAKGFGVPMALIGGSRPIIERFKAVSKTRVHCSPPSEADIAAARLALAVNSRRGESLRKRLLHLVRLFRQGLRTIGLTAQGGCFPIQTLVLPAQVSAAGLHAALEWSGVATVLHRAHRGGEMLISFLLNASHTPTDIEVGLDALRLLVTARTRHEIQQSTLLI